MDLYLKAINEDSSLRFDSEKRIEEVRKCDEANSFVGHKEASEDRIKKLESRYGRLTDNEKGLVHKGLDHIVHNNRNPNRPTMKSKFKNEETELNKESNSFNIKYRDTHENRVKRLEARYGKLTDHEKDLANKGLYHIVHNIRNPDRPAMKSMSVKEESELNLEDFSLEELQDFMMSEDFEQLDELSKGTLASYIKIAAQNLPGHVMQGADINRTGDLKKANKEYSKAIKRRNGIQVAANKLTKEELEEMTKAQMDKREDYVKGMKKNYKDFVSKYGTRAKDVMYATATKMAMKEELDEELNLEDFSLEELQDFMMSEDFEQLDELSKKTLASYIGKASKAYAKHDKQLGLADKANWEKISREDRQKYDKNVRKVSGNKGSLDTNDYDTHDSYHLGKLVKREKGISKAVGKLTKEETELNLEDFSLEESLDNKWNARLKNGYGYGYERFNKGHPLTVIGQDKDHYIVKPFAVMHDGDQKIHKRNVEMLDKAVDKAVGKLTKEETELNLEDFSLEELQDFMMSEDFEQLDELKKSTLASYIRKAGSSLYKMGGDAADAFTDKEIKKSFKIGRKADNREQGLHRAVTKLAKEEYELEEAHDAETYRKYALQALRNKSVTAGNKASYMIGANADRLGLSQKHNPYKSGTSSHKHWAKGLEDSVTGIHRPPIAEETEFNLEDFSLEELQDFMMSEDFEQLDEISQKVLGAHIEKSKKAKIKLHNGEDDGKSGITETADLDEGQKVKTATGYIHKGSYGSEYDTDEDGSEKKKDEPEVKRGRGRPRKGSDESGNVKKYSFHSLLNRLSK